MAHPWWTLAGYLKPHHSAGRVLPPTYPPNAGWWTMSRHCRTRAVFVLPQLYPRRRRDHVYLEAERWLSAALRTEVLRG